MLKNGCSECPARSSVLALFLGAWGANLGFEGLCSLELAPKHGLR